MQWQYNAAQCLLNGEPWEVGRYREDSSACGELFSKLNDGLGVQYMPRCRENACGGIECRRLSAMLIRGQGGTRGLGQPGDRGLREACGVFSAKGWRIREPASDDIAPERPALASSIGRDLSRRGLSAQEVATIAGFSEPSRNSLFRHSGLQAV